MKYLQKMGKSLMLPVAVLPICAICMGLGYLLCPEAMMGGDISGVLKYVGYLLVKTGGAVIDNMAILFAVGVATGMSSDSHGSACLASLVSWLVVTTLLSPTVVRVIDSSIVEGSVRYIAFSKVQNPFFGIACGLIGSGVYDRFKSTKLPDMLAFFSGRRFVLIMTVLVSAAFAAVMGVIWPLLFSGMVAAGKFILGLGGIGVGIYTFLNRLLIPFGLHHALNNVFWFDTIGIGDLTAFWAGQTTAQAGWDVGMYMSGFFPSMIFGIPGAALAIVQASKNKKRTLGRMLPLGLGSCVCGVTEPFEFSFMFGAFPLYVIYSLLYGIVAMVTYYTGFRAGFAFSAGTIDLVFSAFLPAAAKTWLILPLGAGTFLLFWAVFRLYIRFFGFPEDAVGDRAQGSATPVPQGIPADKDSRQAYLIYRAIGGKENIRRVDCCATRLRLEVNDTGKIDQEQVGATGAPGVSVLSKTECQIVIGLRVQQVADALSNYAKAGVSTLSVRRRVRHGDAIAIGGTDFTFLVRDPVGIHARPAGEIVKTVKQFECVFTLSANGKETRGTSVTELMQLGVVKGTEIRVTAEGKDAAAGCAALRTLFEKML